MKRVLAVAGAVLTFSALVVAMIGCGISQDELDVAIGRLEARDEVSLKETARLALAVETMDEASEKAFAELALAVDENNTRAWARIRELIDVNNDNVNTTEGSIARMASNVDSVYDAMDRLREQNSQQREDILSAVDEHIRDSQVIIQGMIDKAVFESKEVADLEGSDALDSRTLEFIICAADKNIHWIVTALFTIHTGMAGETTLEEVEEILMGGITTEQYLGVGTARCYLDDEGWLRFKPEYLPEESGR